MNEWYLRDCSRKQCAAYQARGNAGKPTTNHAIYGYRKDPQDKHHWLLDEEAAGVARRIFHLSMEGHGPHEIASILRDDRIERPSVYMGKRGQIVCFWMMDGMPTPASRAFPGRWSASIFGPLPCHWTENWKRRWFSTEPASCAVSAGQCSILAPTEESIVQLAQPKSTGGKRRKVSGGAEPPVWTIRRFETAANQGIRASAQRGADTFLAILKIMTSGGKFITAKVKQKGIYFKITDQERNLIEQKMALAGVHNMSAYIRKMCIDGYTVNLQIPELIECAKLLRYTSNNINQIARHINSGGMVYPDELTDVLSRQDEINRLFGEILAQLSRIK